MKDSLVMTVRRSLPLYSAAATSTTLTCNKPRLINRILSLAIGLAIWTAFALPASAQTFTVLHTFTGGTKDGATPYGGLINVSGAFYGTTSAGGAHGDGAVYKVTSAPKESLLYSFQGPPSDGATPGYMNLITDGKGNFYGTTAFGGNGPCKSSGVLEGCGTIFKITTAGIETVLYNFQYGPKDGAGPNGTMVRDSAGNLYGTTEAGGNLVSSCMNGEGCGIVFEYTSAGAEKVLYTFCPDAGANCPDGAGPSGVLVRDASGNLYGTTASGGAHLAGTVFKVTSSGKESVLYSFCADASCTDGEGPMGGLALDAKTDTLYGTTVAGGTGLCGQQTTGGGTLFQIGTTGKNFKVLHSFNSSLGDGCNPWGAPILDTAGNIYGTTLLGDSADPAGTVFEFSATGNETVLYGFDYVGLGPTDTLIESAGTLYGTTVAGGAKNDGMVFKLIP
jgi:uncharacterized repeat protein (TIGR03803 family)